MSAPGPNLERKLLIAALFLLIFGCLLVMRPFLSALLWAVVLCFSSWPVYTRVLAFVGNRRQVAALIMTLLMILILLLPFVIVGLTLADNVEAVTEAVKRWMAKGFPPPPDWLGKVPLVGKQVADYWLELIADNSRFWTELQRVIEPLSARLLKTGLALGGGVLQLALSIFITFFLFRDGSSLAEHVRRAAVRIAGEQAEQLLALAGKTVRGVVHGILGTALMQAILAGIGFQIAGVPGPAFRALLTFFASVIPVVGTGLVWIPAVFWLFNQDATGWGVFLIVWGVGIANVDNVVKPWLISHESNMPFLLIFFGVLGGALTFGLIGVFLGPTLLAVGYRLLKEWGAEKAAARLDTPGEHTPRVLL